MQQYDNAATAFLENLNFKPVGKSGRSWLWQDTYYVLVRPPDDTNRFGKTRIIKNADPIFTGDKRENILFQGSYCFDNEDFANRLLKNVGVLEKMTGTKILEHKDTNHRQVLTELGFTEIEFNTWVKNIFLVSLRPPRFENDRGKCLILKKPNVKKLLKSDRPANVVYKGRYFFEDNFFTEGLLERIGFYHFDSRKKNKTYEFTRETFLDSGRYIEEEFLNF